MLSFVYNTRQIYTTRVADYTTIVADLQMSLKLLLKRLSNGPGVLFQLSYTTKTCFAFNIRRFLYTLTDNLVEMPLLFIR